MTLAFSVLSGSQTTNTAEATGLAEALIWAQRKRAHADSIVIRPDSEYALQLALGVIRGGVNAELARGES